MGGSQAADIAARAPEQSECLPLLFGAWRWRDKEEGAGRKAGGREGDAGFVSYGEGIREGKADGNAAVSSSSRLVSRQQCDSPCPILFFLVDGVGFLIGEMLRRRSNRSVRRMVD